LGETIAFEQRPGSEYRTGYQIRQPIGVVLGITLFNDVPNLMPHKVASAIAAGNSIILKPHQRTPLSALELARAVQMSGLPDGTMQVLTGSDVDLGAAHGAARARSACRGFGRRRDRRNWTDRQSAQ